MTEASVTAGEPTVQLPAVEPVPPVPAPPVPPAPSAPAAFAEPVTCPECATPALVTLNRRLASDFCRTCDYPLFWTPTMVVRDSTAEAADDALRRLPGTVGRSTIASLTCPHCAEPNPVTGVDCVRCGLPLQVVELPPPPPPPPPVYVAPPAPVPVEEPRSRQWIAWVLLVLILVVTTVTVVLVATGVLE